MSFGRHRGRTVGELVDDPGTRPYVEWVARDVEGNLGEAARVALDLGTSGRDGG